MHLAAVTEKRQCHGTTGLMLMTVLQVESNYVCELFCKKESALENMLKVRMAVTPKTIVFLTKLKFHQFCMTNFRKLGF